MRRSSSWVREGVVAAALGCAGCATTHVSPPVEPRAAPVTKRAQEVEPAPRHGPRASGAFSLEALLGRKLDELHVRTCAGEKGFQLESGLMIGERALAVRRCEEFAGPHSELEESPGPSRLTVISDGGRIVFAVATREYELGAAKRVAEQLLERLTLAGCEQVQSSEQSVGFAGCPGGPGWAAVSWLALPEERGGGHAVVIEVAESREVAEDIARALTASARP